MSSLRDLPSVDEIARALQHVDAPHGLVVAETRAVLEQARAAAKSGSEAIDVQREVARRLDDLLGRSLRRVINATGVILHTNLGRAPLASFSPIQGYSNLEYDLQTGKRGKRDAHTAGLLTGLIGRDAIVVNNNASAVFLALHELAAGHEVIVSRGELIEIGDGFRIPEIMARSGAVLREVGTTNRTRVEDYRTAITERTRLILRVHPSNFHVSGFTARPSLAELCSLGVPVYEDLGSGCLVDLQRFGIREPLVTDSFKAGVNLLSFSCDKLLGGPQSGIIAGEAGLVERVRRNPMYRAFRVDKLVIEALETTLRCLLLEQWDAVATLRMIAANAETLRGRAERLAADVPGASVREGKSPIGGGSTPDQVLATWVVELPGRDAVKVERQLRLGDPPVIARIEKQRVVLDMRTVAEAEETELVSRINDALHGQRDLS